MPRVSVIVPLYNKARWVIRALDSIASQSFTDFEAIVVDDGSTDGSTALARTYADARFRVLTQANAGPGAARNTGLREASGEYVAFLDADDEWLPDYLAAAVAHLDGPEYAAITTGYFDCPGDKDSGPYWRRRGLHDGIATVNPDTSPELLVAMLAFMLPCSTVSRTAVVRGWGGFYDEDGCRYGEDAFLWLKVLLNERVCFDLTPRVRIHTDAAGLSKNLTKARPLEPFLKYPEKLEQDCPPVLRPLLARFLSTRAFKTACVWGYWGQWRNARDLRRKFNRPGDTRLPYYWPSMVCATPFGAALGLIARQLRGR
jgi:hypothetical protein